MTGVKVTPDKLLVLLGILDTPAARTRTRALHIQAHFTPIQKNPDSELSGVSMLVLEP